MFTEYTREEIAKHDRSPSAAESKNSWDETASALNESIEAKDNDAVVNDLHSPVLYDMEGESLW